MIQFLVLGTGIHILILGTWYVYIRVDYVRRRASSVFLIRRASNCLSLCGRKQWLQFWALLFSVVATSRDVGLRVFAVCNDFQIAIFSML